MAPNPNINLATLCIKGLTQRCRVSPTPVLVLQRHNTNRNHKQRRASLQNRQDWHNLVYRPFFYRATVCKRNTCCRCVSVSVCTPLLCPDSSFLVPKISAKCERGHTNIGAKCRWDTLKSATFDKQLAINRKWYKIDT